LPPMKSGWSLTCGALTVLDFGVFAVAVAMRWSPWILGAREDEVSEMI
jgi:hypothetical protein